MVYILDRSPLGSVHIRIEFFHIDTAGLHSLTGSGISITGIYTFMRYYLQAFFNSLESFHGDRDPDGWKLHSLEERQAVCHADGEDTSLPCEYRSETQITSALVLHVHTLL